MKGMCSFGHQREKSDERILWICSVIIVLIGDIFPCDFIFPLYVGGCEELQKRSFKCSVWAGELLSGW